MSWDLGIGRARHGSSHLTVPKEIGGHEQAGGHLSQRANQPLSRLSPGATPDRSIAIYFPKPECQRHFRNKKGMSKRGDRWALTNSPCPNAALTLTFRACIVVSLGHLRSNLSRVFFFPFFYFLVFWYLEGKFVPHGFQITSI